MRAPEAFRLGTLDKIIEGDLLSGAVAFALEVSKSGLLPKTRERKEKLGTLESNAALFAAGREQARKTRRNMSAPLGRHRRRSRLQSHCRSTKVAGKNARSPRNASRRNRRKP